MTAMEKIRIIEEARRLSDEEWEEIKAELIKVEERKEKSVQQAKQEIETVDTLYYRVSMLLHKIGIPAHIKGYFYLRSAVVYCIGAENAPSLTKKIYPIIAREYNATPARVERAIRHAVETAVKKGRKEDIEKIFGNLDKYYQGKPSNGEAIATLSEYLKFNMD